MGAVCILLIFPFFYNDFRKAKGSAYLTQQVNRLQAGSSDDSLAESTSASSFLSFIHATCLHKRVCTQTHWHTNVHTHCHFHTQGSPGLYCLPRPGSFKLHWGAIKPFMRGAEPRCVAVQSMCLCSVFDFSSLRKRVGCHQAIHERSGAKVCSCDCWVKLCNFLQSSTRHRGVLQDLNPRDEILVTLLNTLYPVYTFQPPALQRHTTKEQRHSSHTYPLTHAHTYTLHTYAYAGTCWCQTSMARWSETWDAKDKKRSTRLLVSRSIGRMRLCWEARCWCTTQVGR